jgi:trans-aconitate methyltransferase
LRALPTVHQDIHPTGALAMAPLRQAPSRGAWRVAATASRGYPWGMAAQSWDPARYAKNARFVADLGAPVVDLLAPKPGERILDLGCGDGALTLKLVQLGCKVLGVDSSPEQISAAQRLGLDVRVLSGECLDYASEFDAVFSNAALHWMKRPDEVIRGVEAALKPGGRFVGELGGHGCVQKIRAALVAALRRRGIDGEARVPWYFPTPGDYATRLERGGFRVDSIALIARPTPLPGDVVGWLETFGQAFTNALPLAARAEYFQEVRVALEPQLQDDTGTWVADYVRLRFTATKPASWT